MAPLEFYFAFDRHTVRLSLTSMGFTPQHTLIRAKSILPSVQYANLSLVHYLISATHKALEAKWACRLCIFSLERNMKELVKGIVQSIMFSLHCYVLLSVYKKYKSSGVSSFKKYIRQISQKQTKNTFKSCKLCLHKGKSTLRWHIDSTTLNYECTFIFKWPVVVCFVCVQNIC